MGTMKRPGNKMKNYVKFEGKIIECNDSHEIWDTKLFQWKVPNITIKQFVTAVYQKLLFIQT